MNGFEKAFPGGPTVACDLALSPDDGSVSVLFGPSGAGKSTILRCLAGLERPTRGTIRFGHEFWFDSELGIEVPPQRRRVGLVPQECALFPHLSVARNIAFGIEQLPRAEREQRVRELLHFVRLGGLDARKPAELSGGQRQRVGLARALAPEPRLLLLDEPLASLDAPTRDELRGELRGVLKALRLPSLFVTHDRTEALALGDRIAVLADGRIRQVGPVAEVFGRPADAEVARIVGVETVVPGRVVGSPGDGLLAVEVGQGAVVLQALDTGAVQDECFVCIRADEVVLERGPIGQVSARNRLSGHVTAVAPEGALVRVSVECGFTLLALVTRQSRVELGLEAGEPVVAFVKTPAVHLVAR